MNYHFFCDIDGVLLNFVTASVTLHGRERWLDNPRFPTNYNYWSDLGLTEEQFWAPIVEAGESWWFNLSDYPWTQELLHMLRVVDKNWSIATSPYNAAAYSARRKWRDIYAPKQRLHVTTDKIELAGPGRVLIDDSHENILRWREAGGIGILFPSNANPLCTHAKDPLYWVRREIQELGYTL